VKLWIVVDHERWGYCYSVVLAATAEDAARLSGASWPLRTGVCVEELLTDGPARVLWSVDESPDSGPGERGGR
jgi:hypothetical protein